MKSNLFVLRCPKTESIMRLNLFIGVMVILSSCSCQKYCLLFRVKSVSPEGRLVHGECEAICDTYGVFATRSKSGEIEGPTPGEYLANTITLGPVLSFKSSNEDYGGGYGDHKPGVGFAVGVGTVLPFNNRWAMAPALRFTQKNASETLSYPGGPGFGGMEFKDKYSYNYLGGTVMAQYRAGKRISLVAGREVNFLLASSVKSGGSDGTGDKQSLNKNSKKVGFDLLAGIKYDVPAKDSRSKWGVQLLYDHRLSRLNKKKDENGIAIPAYKMKGVQLSVAYNICSGCNKKK
jgi:Outer membrane protein beta-barrel domain